MSTIFNTNYMKINTLRPQESEFTQIITSIALVPKKLYYIGTIPKKRHPTVAIVGTRKPTTYGKEVTRQLAYELAKRGVVIVSGLALGIDATAHRAALDAGGMTIAVQANGLAEITPRTNRQLAQDIINNNGAIVSEYEPTFPAQKHTFLERNRIVSGLSDALLITEAAARSGTLNTARHALEQGKDVFVVPGNITSPLSTGCNSLIKQGAMVATCTDDILERVAPHLIQPLEAVPLGDTPMQTKIIELVHTGIRDGDELLKILAISPQEFTSELTMMEISGVIRSLGANQWTLGKGELPSTM